MNASRGSLQIGEDMFREELDDIDESVGGSDTLLGGGTSSRDRSEEEDGGIFRFPIGLRV